MIDQVVESTYIEGVGDELLWVLGVGTITMATVLTSTVILLRQTASNQINPEQLDNVETTRQQLGVTSAREAPPNDRNCPICLNEMTGAIETNCGHTFCANCILTYWNINQWPTGACRCPVCRQNVTLLLRCRGHVLPSDVEQRVNSYNRRMAGEPRSLMEWYHDAPTILRHFFQDLFSFRGLMQLWRLRIAVMLVCMVLYLLSPFDLLPEAALGVIGLLDDLMILLIILVYCTIMYRQVVANRQ